jgi:NAD+ diphosphatase
MTMPFQWPAEYEPAIAPPEPPPQRAWWFVFRAGALLVSESARSPSLPQLASLESMGIEPRRFQYLGRLAGEHCYSAEVAAESAPPAGWIWQELRRLFGTLDEPLFALAGRALQIAEWDRTHQFCGACGSPTASQSAERSRRCPGCNLIAYPRLAPAIMCLVRRTDRGRPELLLGRSPRFPRDMYSVLAGFAEPGETLEQCVEREVYEEVGVRVSGIRYFASQPWPFPHSLMIAFVAEYAGGEITPDPAEIEEARWFPIDELPKLPARISIARRLIDGVMDEMIAARR